jgi:hypothetical protein
MICLSKHQRRVGKRALITAVVCSLAVTGAALAAPPGYTTLRKISAKAPNARYVSPNGSDSNPGTLARPWRTVEHAMGASRPGQTVLLRGGTYNERATVTTSGAQGAPITLKGYPRERATYAGQLTIQGDWIQVSGIRFTRGSESSSDDVLVYVSGGDHVEVSGNNMFGSPMSAIFVGDEGNTADDVRILGNRIHDNGDDSQFHHGIYCGHSRAAVIANNIVEHNAAFGVQVYPDCSNADVSHNTIVANGQSGVVVGTDGGGTTQNVRVVNNIIVGNRASGVQTVWEGNSGSGIVARNLISGNGRGVADTEGLTVSGTIRGAPRFVNYAGRNYRLKKGSPAIGRATVALSPGRDIGGRPRGTRRDLGAVEAVPGR